VVDAKNYGVERHLPLFSPFLTKAKRRALETTKRLAPSTPTVAGLQAKTRAPRLRGDPLLRLQAT